MWANFHTHSDYCDGVGQPADHVRAAREAGVTSLGFSSHAPLPFECTWCMKKEEQPRYLKDIASFKTHSSDLQVYCGMEVDFIPGTIAPADYQPVLDYTIGSIHFVEQFDDGHPWEIDGTHAVFLDGLAKIFANNIRDAVSRYFELTREMLRKGPPDVVGHLDKIKIQNAEEKFFRESDRWYKDQVALTLDAIADAGAITEVNTRGLYQKKSKTSYPSPWILEELYRRKLPITLSSDAHHPKDLCNQFSEVAALLFATGFRKIHILKDGSWQPVTLNPDSLVF